MAAGINITLTPRKGKIIIMKQKHEHMHSLLVKTLTFAFFKSLKPVFAHTSGKVLLQEVAAESALAFGYQGTAQVVSGVLRFSTDEVGNGSYCVVFGCVVASFSL